VLRKNRPTFAFAPALGGIRLTLPFARALACITLAPAAAQSVCVTPVSATVSAAPAAAIDNSLWTAVLADHVRNGFVDYRAIKKDARFAEYIRLLESTDPFAIPQDERLAFWINAYNAFTVRIVCDQYPIESIMSRAARLVGQSNFQKKLIRMSGVAYSLDDIEHEHARPFGDARVHFALVCAARSCPPLRSEAYEAHTLSEQLEDQGRAFVRDARKNRFDFERRECHISRIFDWFRGDFESGAPSALHFISRYLPDEQGARLRDEAARFTIHYQDYDWALNDVPRAAR
jgi:hypothetical protein